MARRTVQITRSSAAPPAEVWKWLSDVETWTQWGLFDEARLERPGSPDRNGVGARRMLKADRIRNVEEVLIFEPPTRIRFALVEGTMPVREYRSEVLLEENAAGGTNITWRARYEPKFPGTGWLLDRNFKLLLAEISGRLARHAAGKPVED